MALRLGFDVDGVVADFRTAFRATARRVLRRDIDAGGDPGSQPAQDLERVWNTIASTHNWWTKVEPYEPRQIVRLYETARASRWEVVFLTKRPPSGGDTVQLQTQWWLEQHGFLMPAVVTVPGSRGDLANALRLDLAVDDQFINCAEIVGASTTKTVLLLRDEAPGVRDHATSRGIGVVSSLEEAIGVVERLHQVLPKRRGKLLRLSDWFGNVGVDAPMLAPVPNRPSLSEPVPSSSSPQPPPGASRDPS